MNKLPPDPYKALGVSRNATIAEIRAAHRKLVLTCHPDKVQDPELKAKKQDEFHKVQQAYELLNDEEKRHKYEQDLAKSLAKAKEREAYAKMPSQHAAASPGARYVYHVHVPHNSSPYPGPPPRAQTFHYGNYGASRSDDNHRAYSRDDSPPPRRPDSFESRRYDEDRRERGGRRSDREGHNSSRDDLDRAERQRQRQADKDAAAERAEKEAKAERKRVERARREREEQEELEQQKRRDDRRREREAAEDLQRAEAKLREERVRDERKKKVDKDRKKSGDEKAAKRRDPYVEDYPEGRDAPINDDVYPSSKSDKEKKAKSSKKHDTPREKSKPRETTPKPDKVMDAVAEAAKYMQGKRIGASSSARSGPPRAATFPDAAIAPPAVPVPPQDHDSEDEVRRSSARPRRASHDNTPRGIGRRGSADEPIVLNASPPKSRKPGLHTYNSMPPIPSEDPRPPHRSQTEYARPPPVPGMRRAQTFNDYMDSQPRSRRPSHQETVPEYGTDSEDERDRRARRSHRRTQSPDKMPERPSMDRTGGSSRYVYTVGSNNKTSRRHESHRDSDNESPSARKVSSSRYPIVTEYDSDTQQGGRSGYAGSPFGKVKEAKAYSTEDVKYASAPYTARNHEPYYAQAGYVQG